MDPDAITETYVRDVVRRLPRRQRDDVGYELRSLLDESLEGRAADAGRPADEAMTMELLTAFGRPQDVADRYRPAGFTVIRPADAPRFVQVALGGVALQWAFTLPAALAGPAGGDASGSGAQGWPGRLAGWWLTWGLGAFWWPGLLVTFAVVAAATGHRRGGARIWAPPRVTDRDRVSRPAVVVALALWVAGATVLVALPWLAVWAPDLPQPLLDAFALDPEFVRVRAPWVLLLWAASFGLHVAVLLAGRWSRRARRTHVGLDLGWLALLVWWLAAGRIFVTDGADGAARLGLLVVVVVVVTDIVATLRRDAAPIRPPTGSVTRGWSHGWRRHRDAARPSSSMCTDESS